MDDETRLKEDAKLRQALRSDIVKVCETEGLVIPERHTDPERLALRLLALPREPDEIKREIERHRTDRSLLPQYWEALVDANIPQRALVREKIRHAVSLIFGGLASVVTEAVIGIFEALLEASVLALSRMAVVLVPGGLIFFTYCALVTFRHEESLTLGLIGSMLLGGIWLGLLASGVALLVYSLYLGIKRHRASKAADADGDAPRAFVIRRAGED